MLSSGRVHITRLKPLHSSACGAGRQVRRPFQHWKRLENPVGCRWCIAVGMRHWPAILHNSISS